MKLALGALALAFASLASSASAGLVAIPYNISSQTMTDGVYGGIAWGFDGDTLYEVQDAGVRGSAMMGDRYSKMYAGISGATVSGQSLSVGAEGTAQTMVRSGQSVSFTGNYYVEGSLVLQSLGTIEERNASVFSDPNTWLGQGTINGATTFASLGAGFGFTSGETFEAQYYSVGWVLKMSDWVEVYAEYDEFGEMVGGPQIASGTNYEAYRQVVHFFGGSSSEVTFDHFSGPLDSLNVAFNFAGQFDLVGGVDYVFSSGTSCGASISAATGADASLLGAVCDSSHSGYWNGITNVKDETGAPVSGYALTTSEGVNLVEGSPLSPAPIGSAAPEPSTWALLLGGFGFVGGILRAQRRAFAAA